MYALVVKVTIHIQKQLPILLNASNLQLLYYLLLGPTVL